MVYYRGGYHIFTKYFIMRINLVKNIIFHSFVQRGGGWSRNWRDYWTTPTGNLDAYKGICYTGLWEYVQYRAEYQVAVLFYNSRNHERFRAKFAIYFRGFSFFIFHVNIFIFMSHGTCIKDYVCNKDMQGIKRGKTWPTQTQK